MCVVSMVMDHYTDKWRPLTDPFALRPSPPATWTTPPVSTEPPITDAEIREFRQLLERAREYDKKHNEPDCELQSKRDALKAIAAQLGIDVSFVDEVKA